MPENEDEKQKLDARARQREDARHEEEAEASETEAEERESPSGLVVYKAVLGEGEQELDRPTAALFWSGLAAGLSMGFSLLAEGVLRSHLPADAAWTPLITKFGYSVGFLLVILGRQQLFTENTLTPILPLLLRRNLETLLNVARLWSVVLAANLLGALIYAWLATHTSAFEHDVRRAMLDVAHEATSHGFGTVVLKGVFAGWLIAMIVWLLPFAEAARVWVIVAITYVVGTAELSHVVAGSVEAFVLGWSGERAWLGVIGGFIVPALIGNVIGGVTFVAALNHAQVLAGKAFDDPRRTAQGHD